MLSSMEASPHERLRQWRLRREQTQEALAEVLGCSKAQVCLIERAQRNPGRALSARIERLTARSNSPIRVEDWP